ncbi:MAG: sigma-70 family RNA polymerase sigma factor [Clostridia bacterium]|nr:sigma-70 family RNA polymerase sigma factor [Clostridia bacterium]
MEKNTATPPPSGDEKIIDMYWERDPDAIQETDRKYGSFLRNVAYNILFDVQDCEECKNDAYLGIWNAIPSARPAAFPAFIMRIMRQIAIRRYREKSRKKRIPSQLTISLEELDAISSDPSVEEAYEAKEVGRLITEYLKQLSERQRYIFIDRYYLAEPVEKTAAELSISVRTAYNEIEKIKQGLKDYLERNGVHV